MKNLTLFIALIFTHFSYSSIGKVRSGDVLLQPLKCYTCSLIESETKSEYSHIGLYIKFNGVPFVLEAIGGVVKRTPLKTFLKRTEKGSQVKVVRHIDIESLVHTKWKFKEFRLSLYHSFTNYFEGKPYDKEFLWFNQNSKGEEKLYCSEFVQKILAAHLDEVPMPKPMDFSINYEAWKKHFKGNVPTGELGLSPGDFDRSYLFETVTYL